MQEPPENKFKNQNAKVLKKREIATELLRNRAKTLVLISIYLRLKIILD
jgi:hypothetical protein